MIFVGLITIFAILGISFHCPTTPHRKAVMRWLKTKQPLFHGARRTLDIGSKPKARKGLYAFPRQPGDDWLSLDINPANQPDIVASAISTGCPDNYFDTVLCIETLEHIPDPQKAIAEIHRILKPGGVALVSVPFFFPIHADPDDYFRFTAQGLRHLFRRFDNIRIQPTGFYGAALTSQLLSFAWKRPRLKYVFYLAALIVRTFPFMERCRSAPSGYTLEARKKPTKGELLE